MRYIIENDVSNKYWNYSEGRKQNDCHRYDDTLQMMVLRETYKRGGIKLLWKPVSL